MAYAKVERMAAPSTEEKKTVVSTHSHHFPYLDRAKRLQQHHQRVCVRELVRIWIMKSLGRIRAIDA